MARRPELCGLRPRDEESPCIHLHTSPYVTDPAFRAFLLIFCRLFIARHRAHATSRLAFLAVHWPRLGPAPTPTPAQKAHHPESRRRPPRTYLSVTYRFCGLARPVRSVTRHYLPPAASLDYAERIHQGPRPRGAPHVSLLPFLAEETHSGCMLHGSRTIRCCIISLIIPHILHGPPLESLYFRAHIQ